MTRCTLVPPSTTTTSMTRRATVPLTTTTLLPTVANMNTTAMSTEAHHDHRHHSNRYMRQLLRFQFYVGLEFMAMWIVAVFLVTAVLLLQPVPYPLQKEHSGAVGAGGSWSAAFIPGTGTSTTLRHPQQRQRRQSITPSRLPHWIHPSSSQLAYERTLQRYQYHPSQDRQPPSDVRPALPVVDLFLTNHSALQVGGSTTSYQLILESSPPSTTKIALCQDKDDNDYDFSGCRLTFPMDIPSSKRQTNKNGAAKIPTDGRNQVDDASSVVVVMTCTGHKGYSLPNQDHALVIQQPIAAAAAATAPTATTHAPNGHSWLLAALFDGHGASGHVSSLTAAMELPFAILQALAETNISNSRTSSKVETTAIKQQEQQQHPNENDNDKEIIMQLFRRVFAQVDAGRVSTIREGGTTALIALVWNDKVYFASAGDSTALLVSYDATAAKLSSASASNRGATDGHPSKSVQHNVVVQIEMEAVKHKPADPIERARITAAGGTVYIPTAIGESSRVVFTVTGNYHGTGDSLPLQQQQQQQQEVALAMSRCLGDADGKKQRVLTAEPSVRMFDLHAVQDQPTSSSSRQYFLVVASDGIMDMLSNQYVAQQLAQAFAGYHNDDDDDDGNRHRNTLRLQQEALSAKCHQLLDEATEAWAEAMHGMYRDDMTLLVSPIQIKNQ